MVFTKKKYALTHNETKMLPVGGRAPEAVGGMCPRCNTQLRQTYLSEEPECPACGYIDYTYIPPIVKSEGPRLMESAVINHVVYKGDSQALGNVTLGVRSERMHPRTPYGPANSGSSRMKDIPSCPFPSGKGRCGEDMGVLPETTQERKRNERRYACADGHQVRIITENEGNQWWR